MHRVFLYGTLKTHEINAWHMTDDSHGKAVFVGKGRTSKRYPLVLDINKGYNGVPVMIDKEGLGHHVEGEIWEVDDTFLKWLDKFEGHPELYCRKTMQITDEDNSKEETCYIYLFMKLQGEISESSTFLQSYKVAECGYPYKVT